MHMRQIKSSNIEAVGHDGRSMRIRFKNGSVYEYANVSAQEYAELATAESPGKHFIAMIRNAKPSRVVSELELAAEARGEEWPGADQELVLDGEIELLPMTSAKPEGEAP